jgi:Hemocyanin, all-alpha domain/Hemocyanin, copper containing domain
VFLAFLDPNANFSINFQNKEYVKDFLIAYKKGMLPRGDIFSVYYEPHRAQMIKLFDLFYFAKDYETLYKIACWSRDRVNEYMFVYALSVAVYHRADMRGVVLPPFYEMFPQKFVDSEVVFKAYHEYLNHKNTPEYTVSIPVSNYTEFWTKHDVEQRISYFGEDLGIGMHNKFMHLEYPFWMEGKKYGLTMDRKGELFYWIYDQLLSRYEMERVANWMPETEAIDFVNPIVKVNKIHSPAIIIST